MSSQLSRKLLDVVEGDFAEVIAQYQFQKERYNLDERKRGKDSEEIADTCIFLKKETL